MNRNKHIILRVIQFLYGYCSQLFPIVSNHLKKKHIKFTISPILLVFLSLPSTKQADINFHFSHFICVSIFSSYNGQIITVFDQLFLLFILPSYPIMHANTYLDISKNKYRKAALLQQSFHPAYQRPGLHCYRSELKARGGNEDVGPRHKGKA